MPTFSQSDLSFSQKICAGLGLRAPHLKIFAKSIPDQIDFFEVHPENYIRRGGLNRHYFEEIATQKKILAHGLTLGFGNPEMPDKTYLRSLKDFLREFQIPLYSDHLCLSAGSDFQFYDLLPLPFSSKTIAHVATRICRLRDYLNVEIAVENVSTYLRPTPDQMSESEFTHEVLKKSQALLLLDVNNVYVNSQNHGFDPCAMLRELSSENIAYIHLAGFDRRPSGILIDTHGTTISQKCWDLLEYLGLHRALPPVLIERDNNIPENPALLLSEVTRAHDLVNSSRGIKS